MTTALLDTHAFVWATTNPSRLSDASLTIIQDATSTLLVSAASVWEMAIKYHAGRWPEAETLLRSHDDICVRLGAQQIPITSDDAFTAGTMRWPHSDPFDRMLAAQAIRRQCSLVSRDGVFAQLPGLDVVW